MNVWRWLGISIFFVGALCLLSTTKFPVRAGGEKKTSTTTPGGKVSSTTTVEEKKKADEPKKSTVEDPKKDPPKKGELQFKAFDTLKVPFYTEQRTVTKQTMTVLNQKVTQDQDQTFLIKWTPLEKDAPGNVTVAQQIVGVKMEINIGGNKISYDSTKPNPKNPMTDFFEQLTKSELKFIIKPNLEVLKVEGRDAFIKNLTDINPQMTTLLKAILDDKALIKMAEPTWWAFPAGGAIGPAWKQTSNLNLGPIGSYVTEFEFTHAGTAAEKDTIDIKTKLTYTAPGQGEKAGLPFIIHEGKLTGESGSGKAIFDRKLGRFESNTMNMKLTGQLKIEVGNMPTTVELTQEQAATTTTFSDIPAAWKKAP